MTARGPSPAILGRRGCLAALMGLASAPALASPDSERDRSDWEVFRARWVERDGRVVDRANRGISHSEGQGAGLLFAARFDDRASFDRILAWTRTALRRPSDMLHSWRFTPGAAAPVDDPNNATDGDLLIAWALALAHERWGEAEHRRLAVAIGRDVLRLCTRRVGGRKLLLPGAFGFVHADHVVVNPSYYMFGAFQALHRLSPDPIWGALRADGLALLRECRFGRWGLPADWVRLPAGGGGPIPAPPWPARFAWDAVRVPLYLVWGGHLDEPAVQAAAAFWADPAKPVLPAWVDLQHGFVAPYPASPGVEAVARLSIAAAAGQGRRAALPGGADARDYYSAKLVLMSHLAWEAMAVAAVPGRFSQRVARL